MTVSGGRPINSSSPSGNPDPSLTLRPPAPDEYDLLTDLCLRSKAVHGYDASFMALCRAELSVTPERVKQGPAQVAVGAGSVLPIGYSQVIREDGLCWLEALFVDPTAMGTGIGKALFLWATGAARQLGATQMEIASDPGAVNFYRAMGAIESGEVPSDSIPGRRLPRLVQSL